MFWSCFGHLSFDLIKYLNEYPVNVRNCTRCKKWPIIEGAVITAEGVMVADMDTGGVTDG